jgi:hypothetical protein
MLKNALIEKRKTIKRVAAFNFADRGTPIVDELPITRRIET